MRVNICMIGRVWFEKEKKHDPCPFSFGAYICKDGVCSCVDAMVVLCRKIILSQDPWYD